MRVLRLGFRQAQIGTYSGVGSRFLSSGDLDSAKKLRKKDFEYCVDLVQNRDRESYICGLLMPEKSRRSYFAVRALNVELASIKEGGLNRKAIPGNDSEEPVVADASLALKFRAQWWRDAIGQIYGDEMPTMRTGNPSDKGFLASIASSAWNNPVVRVLNNAVHEKKLTRRFIERLLEAREDDLAVKQLDTMDEAVLYAERTFSSLIYLSLETTDVSAGLDDRWEHTGPYLNTSHTMLKVREDDSDTVAYHAGIGVGLVTALRGARLRLARGECSIPKELIPPRFPYQKLNTRDPKAELTAEEMEQVRAAVKEMAMLASSHLVEARNRQGCVPKHARPSLLPVVPALHFLTQLEGVDYDLFDDRLLEPNQLRVLLLLGRTWLTGVF